jgi:hypothetical protein
MDDSTKKTGGTVVQLYTSNASGRDSPDDARQIQGTLLTFADKTYYAGAGRFKEEVQLGTRFVVVDVRAGWKRWDGGKVAQFVQQIAGHYPLRHELGFLDEAKWPRGPDGKSADLWQDSREVVLNNQDDYTGFTFCTSSGGGRSAVDALRDSIGSARLLRPGQWPIIELGWRPMNTRFGMKAKPILKIVGWWRPEPTNIAPTDDLNDKIPDLSA